MRIQQLFGMMLPVALSAGLSSFAVAAPAVSPHTADRRVARDYAQIPGWFESAPGGAYVSRGHSGSIALDRAGFGVGLRHAYGEPERVLAVTLPGANALNWNAEQPLAGRTSYFLTGDQSQWRTGVEQFARVRARGVYQGVDLLVYGQTKRMEYDFLVAPGADPSQIRFSFSKGWRASLTKSGDLNVTDGAVSFVEHKPVAYQQRNGARVEVASNFVLHKDGTVGFHVGRYDRDAELVIDPVLQFSGYFGGSADEEILGVAVDPKGGYWITGTTTSTIATVAGTTPYATARSANRDVFLAKIAYNADSTASLVYFTYYGAPSDEIPAGLAVASDGTIAVAGTTNSGSTASDSAAAASDIPRTSGAFQSAFGGGNDAFVFKYDPSKSGTAALIYSSYFGGTSTELASAVAFDNAGNIVVVGATNTNKLPKTGTTAGFQTTGNGGYDCFIIRVNPSLSGDASLLYSTYYGGNTTDLPNAVKVDANNRIFLTGYTYSTSLKMAGGSYQSAFRNFGDAFLAVIDPTATGDSQLVYSTFLGGEKIDVATSLALDAQGRAWITGYTLSKGFPVTPTSYQPALTGTAAGWVTCIDITKTGAAQLVYSTYLNGTSSTIPYAIALDAKGRVTVAGYTNSTDFPVVNPIIAQQPVEAVSGFLATLDPTQKGTGAMIYSATIGGPGITVFTGLAYDAAGNLFIGGYSSDADFPATDGIAKPSPEGANSGVFMLLSPDPTLPAATTNGGVN